MERQKEEGEKSDKKRERREREKERETKRGREGRETKRGREGGERREGLMKFFEIHKFYFYFDEYKQIRSLTTERA